VTQALLVHPDIPRNRSPAGTVSLGETLDVAAGTKRPARSGQHDAAHIVGDLDFAQREHEAGVPRVIDSHEQERALGGIGVLSPVGSLDVEHRFACSDHQLLRLIDHGAFDPIGTDQRGLVREDLAASDVQLTLNRVGDLDGDRDAGVAVAVRIDDAGVVRVGRERLVERIVEHDTDGGWRERPTQTEHAVSDLDSHLGRRRLNRLGRSIGQACFDCLVGALL